MKYLRNGFYLGILLLTLLTACGGATPTIMPTPTGLVNLKPPPAPNVAITLVVPFSAVPLCTPPVPTIGDVSSYCVNPVKGLGGNTYSDTTYVGGPDNPAYWMLGPSIGSNVSCSLENGQGSRTCTGPQNATFQVTDCSACGDFNYTDYGSPNASFVCAKGNKKDSQGACIPGTNALDWCPAGSHYDNALQNCADNVTEKLASPCPPGYPNYTPFDRRCWNKAVEVFNCQTFPLQLGACFAKPKKIGQCPLKQTYMCDRNGSCSCQ
jgi:hypothetical protein